MRILINLSPFTKASLFILALFIGSAGALSAQGNPLAGKTFCISQFFIDGPVTPTAGVYNSPFPDSVVEFFVDGTFKQWQINTDNFPTWSRTEPAAPGKYQLTSLNWGYNLTLGMTNFLLVPVGGDEFLLIPLKTEKGYDPATAYGVTKGGTALLHLFLGDNRSADFEAFEPATGK